MLVLAAKGKSKNPFEKRGVVQSGMFSNALLLEHTQISMLNIKQTQAIHTLSIVRFVFPVCSVPHQVSSFPLFPIKAKQAPSIPTCHWRNPHDTQPEHESGPNMEPFASEGNSVLSRYFIYMMGFIQPSF